MIDRIGTKLTETVGETVPFFFSEAEVDGYPYGVYDLETVPVMTKDGVHHLVGEVEVNIYSDKYDEASSISETIQESIDVSMNTDEFSSFLTFMNDECNGGIWVINLKYIIKQYK